jgi:hypothetical protein
MIAGQLTLYVGLAIIIAITLWQRTRECDIPPEQGKRDSVAGVHGARSVSCAAARALRPMGGCALPAVAFTGTAAYRGSL